MGHGKSRGTRRHRRCNQHRKSAFPTVDTCETYRYTMFKTHAVTNILFTNESHHDYAHVDLTHLRNLTDTNRQLSCRTQEMASQTEAQSNQRHLCQHMEKWSKPPHPRPSTPFGSTLQTTCHPRSRHTERPHFEVKSSMSIARVGCGNFAWSMGTIPSNLVNTDISSQKNNSVCQY